MSWMYLLCPILSWVTAGTLKSIIRACAVGPRALLKIGSGGFPSNHTTIVASITALIAFDQGINTPIFGVALSVLLVTVFDAVGLRGQVGKHAELLNQSQPTNTVLHERIGHTRIEVIGGAILGLAIGFGVYKCGQISG